MNSSSSKHLNHKAESKEETLLKLPQRITELVENESDRGVILILGAYLDEILGLLITGACVSDTLAAGILKHGQPGGNFNSRILLAQAFGLIHEEDVQALRIIQKIRNKAAHFDLMGRGFDVLFDSPITANQIAELSALFYEELSDHDPLVVRRAFIESARNTATRLLLRRSDIKRPVPPESTQELIAEALSISDDPHGFIAKLRKLSGTAEMKTEYQGMVQVISKLFVNSRASTDGNGLPIEMMPAIADFLSRAGGLDLDILRKDEKR